MNNLIKISKFSYGQAGSEGYLGQNPCIKIPFPQKVMFWPTLKIDNKIAKESSKTLETVTIEDKKIISKSD